MLNNIKDEEEKRCGYVHLYGVGMSAALIALKRSNGRIYAELAQIAGMLHDYVTYQRNDNTDHAHACEPIARDILSDCGEFTEDEINLICTAIYNHSDKNTVDGEFDEILKDADVMQHWLRNPMEDYWFDNIRVQRLIKEFDLHI